MVRIKRGGLRFSAPRCSSFVPACVGKTHPISIFRCIGLGMCSYSHVFACSASLRKRNIDPVGDESLTYVKEGNEIAVP